MRHERSWVIKFDQTCARVIEHGTRDELEPLSQKAIEPEWEGQMLAVRANPRVGLELIPTPSPDGHFVSAPPVLIASTP